MEEYVDYNDRKLKIMSAGDVLDYSLELFKKNFKQISLVVGIFNIPIFIILGLFFSDIIDELTIYWIDFFDPLLYAIYNQSRFEKYLDMNFLLAIAFFIHFFTFQLIIDFMVINIIYNDILFDRKINTFKYIKKAIINMPSLILNKIIFWIATFIIYSFVMLINLFAVYFAIFIFGISLVLLMSSSFYIIIAIITIIVASIFYVCISTSMYPFFRTCLGKVMVSIERRNGASAYAKSLFFGGASSHIHIFKSSWFGFLIISFIVIAILLLLIILSMLFSNFVVSMGETLFAVSSFITFIAFFFIYPLFWVIYTVIYVNMEVTKEGLDLELYIEKLHAKQRMSSLRKEM